jgi:hypothetical protein
MIEKIVSGTKDAILSLLTQIRLKVGKAKGGHLNECTDSRQKTSLPLKMLCREKKKNEKVDYLALLKKKNQKLSEKEELISTPTEMVSNLETLLQLKNKDIKDLSSELGLQDTVYFTLPSAIQEYVDHQYF